ncbi:MAG: DMT family transporter [Planctomycetota bacterium]
MTHPTPQTMSHHQQRIGLILALSSAALFSLKGVVVKLALTQGVNVETLMLWRMAMSLPVYVVVGGLVLRRAYATASASPSRATFAAAAGLGVLSYYVCTWLDFTGMRFISAQLERMVLFTYPILTAGLSWLLLGERFTRRHALALILSYAGIILVFRAEAQSVGPDAAWGIGLVFSAALLFAFYVIFAKVTIRRMGPKLFTCVAMIAATLAIVTHNVVRLKLSEASWLTVFSLPAVTAGIFLAAVCTVLPSFMLSEAIDRIGAGRTSAAGNVGPVVTTIAAVTILGEPFGLSQAGGLALILLGVGMLGKVSNA